MTPTTEQAQAMNTIDDGTTRTFATGATRDTADGKLDYEGFLSPVAIRAFAEYMHLNRVQSDGTIRASDNWQKGFPYDVLMKSAWRHFVEVWTLHRAAVRNGYPPPPDIRKPLCALLFNVMAYLHQIETLYATPPTNEHPKP